MNEEPVNPQSCKEIQNAVEELLSSYGIRKYALVISNDEETHIGHMGGAGGKVMNELYDAVVKALNPVITYDVNNTN